MTYETQPKSVTTMPLGSSPVPDDVALVGGVDVAGSIAMQTDDDGYCMPCITLDLRHAGECYAGALFSMS